MTERRVLHIEISSPDESLHQFADVWDRVGQGDRGGPGGRVAP